jgi:ribosomal protein S12 methylthiotransferase
MTKGLSIIGESAANAGSCSVTPELRLLNVEAKHLEANKFLGRAAVITLGCAKNQVDSEIMLGVLRKRGFEIVSDLELADVAIVNTCGFLQSSVQESVDCVLNVADYKKTGRLKKLVVAGCMVQRYSGSLEKDLPEVDQFIGVNDILSVAEAAGAEPLADFLTSAERPYFLYDESMPRQLDSMPHSAWVKIAEGCNRPCTFCIIPQIRGPMRSRPIDSIVREVAELSARGVKEVNLVAQDLTDFGSDQAGKPKLAHLLKALDEQTRIKWIRLLYTYPLGITDELLAAILAHESVCKYIDVPLQHASEAVLRKMQRPLGKNSPRGVVERIYAASTDIAIRTTFIVGFPGETEQDIMDLEQFVRESNFSSVGVFTYSPEQGTPSFDMDGHIPEKEKNARRSRIMLAQQEVQNQRLKKMIGKEFEVLIDGEHEETELLWVARTRFQAPEVDGTVIINDVEEALTTAAGGSEVAVGQIRKVQITEVAGYDLVGKLI